VDHSQRHVSVFSRGGCGGRSEDSAYVGAIGLTLEPLALCSAEVGAEDGAADRGHGLPRACAMFSLLRRDSVNLIDGVESYALLSQVYALLSLLFFLFTLKPRVE